MGGVQYPEFAFPGLEPEPAQPERNMPNLGARNAFGRVPFPEYWGVTGDKFVAVTAEQEALVEPMHIAEQLGGRDTRFAINGVVFNPDEYMAVPTSVRTYAQRVGARAVGARMHLETDTESAVSVDKRAIAIAFASEIPKLNNLEKMYTEEIENLRWLLAQLPHHWHAHGNEMNMRMHVVSARRSFENMVETVAASQDWPKHQLREAKLAQEKRLLYGPLEAKKAEWTAWTRNGGNYALGKRGVVRNKRDELIRRIKEAETVE